MRILFPILLLSACADDPAGDSGGDPTGCSTDDADGDGLDGCTEETIGTDPDVADSDGDGTSDGDESACVSDPLDPAEVCYACGWPHADPGTIESTGNDEGDVIENLALIDQCGDEVSLWDFAQEYHILFLTAEW